ncbi:MAG: 3-oxoacyl-ACP reductase [Propionibacterium sp.]|nr:3-oxoacyl-ACP reductase [Propionibacterium sp.]
MSNETSLDGKAAVVTGAGAGLGRSEALALARQGANVVVNDIGEKADEVVAEIKALGRDAIAVKGDVSDWKLAEDLVNAAVDTWGSLDILVNNAGVLRDTVLFNMTEQMWDDVIRVHLKGHAATSTHAAKYWRAKGKAAGDQKIFGRVINTSSEAGLFGSGGQPNYSAAKAGITALTLSTSQALAKYGVTANVIAPRARTEMTSHVFAEDPNANATDILSPDRVADFVAYLASPASQKVNGQLFVVYGKFVALLKPAEVEKRFDAAGEVFTVDELAEQFAPYFAERSPYQTFAAYSLAKLDDTGVQNLQAR